MDPDACLRNAIRSVTTEEWRSYMADYNDWRNNGGFAADPKLIKQATDRYYELRFQRKLNRGAAQL